MKDSHGEAVRWLRQAENDLDFARLALKEGFFHQACFISQQAAEKALKSILYAFGERVVLGHSLVDLLKRLSGRVPEITARKEAAGVLDQYYVAARYPNGLPGGMPFEVFGQTQAKSATEEAAGFVALAGRQVASLHETASRDQAAERPVAERGEVVDGAREGEEDEKGGE
jgi:HEPN domain-containing protein